MAFVKRLSIGNQVLVPLAEQVDLGLNSVGSATFDVPADRVDGLQPSQACRLYVGRTERLTFLVFQGTLAHVAHHGAGVARMTVRQRCAALEQEHTFALSDCTARHVLQEIVEAAGVPVVAAAPDAPGAAYLDTPIPRFAAKGPLTGTLGAMGAAFQVPDAVWYEQADGRIFWGNWAATPAANAPLPLQRNVILEADPDGRAVRIPLVPSLRPGMLVRLEDNGEFRIDRMQVSGDSMRLTWRI